MLLLLPSYTNAITYTLKCCIIYSVYCIYSAVYCAAQFRRLHLWNHIHYAGYCTVVAKWSMADLMQSIAVSPNTLLASYPVAVKYYVVQVSVWEGSSVLICTNIGKEKINEDKKSFLHLCVCASLPTLLRLLPSNADYPVEERLVSGRRGCSITMQ